MAYHRPDVADRPAGSLLDKSIKIAAPGSGADTQPQDGAGFVAVLPEDWLRVDEIP